MVQIKWKLGFALSKFCKVSRKGASSGRRLEQIKIQLVLEAVVMGLTYDAEEGCDSDSACEEHGRLALILVHVEGSCG